MLKVFSLAGAIALLVAGLVSIEAQPRAKAIPGAPRSWHRGRPRLRVIQGGTSRAVH